MIKLSFIIPVYNGAKYLPQCLDSLLDQDIPYSDYEIICVNDCSTDNSKDVIEAYQKQYKNIKLINFPKNLKTGTACNAGLSNAQGKYIWLIGQDDFIENKCLNNLLQECDTKQLDVLCFNYKRVDENENGLHSAEVFQNTEVFNGYQYIKTYFETNFEHYLLGYEWRAIFNREYLTEKEIKFQDGVIYEDTIFLFKAMLYANRLASLNRFIYHYRVNSYSITDINKKYKGFLIYEFAFVAGNEVEMFADEIKTIHPKYSEVLRSKAKWYYSSFSYKIIGASIKEKLNFYNLVKSNFSYVYDKTKDVDWYVRALINPYYGLFLAITLKPFYILKLKFKNKPKQTWSY